MTPELEDLCNRIADHWGGKECKRFSYTNESDGYERFGFMGDEGHSRYTVSLPGTRSPMFEDSGRPSRSLVVPKDCVIVRCLDDAPDAVWEVKLDGSFDIWGRKGQV